MNKLLKGKPAADAIDEQMSARIQKFYERGIVPTLAIVQSRGESKRYCL